MDDRVDADQGESPRVFWCDRCLAPLVVAGRSSLAKHCPTCGSELRYLATDIRPVFARERRILQFYGHDLSQGAIVWKSGSSPHYNVDGTSVCLPVDRELKSDLPAIAAFIAAQDGYDELDDQLLQVYARQFQGSRLRLSSLEDEALQFIQQAVHRFPRRMVMVSFSGGKDSTVVSDLVCRALGRADVLHVFSDTTLEDDNTYDYVRQFQETNPLIPFFQVRADQDFFELVDRMGPPSRAIRWCCTILKAGPINAVLQSFREQEVLTFYGIRHGESTRRSKYHRASWNDTDRLGVVVKVDKDNERNGVTLGAKIGQQMTAAPIVEWSEFDVWNYIVTHRLQFNKSYRFGFRRVGCWLCPFNSRWSEALTAIFFPQDAERWRARLIDFAKCVGKPDPEEYVNQRAWVRRSGGSGLPNRFLGLSAKPCGEQADTVQIQLERPVSIELEEYLKPLGKLNRERSRPILGEIYLDAHPRQEWDGLIVQAPEHGTTLRFTVVNPRTDIKKLSQHFKKQAIKYQTCIYCTACAVVCPQNAIRVDPGLRIYAVDQEACDGCLACVTHFGARGCLVADALHAGR